MAGTECRDESCCTTLTVSGGSFPMGRSETGTDAYLGVASEQPEHTVTVSSFTLDKYEVTVGRFRGFVDAYPLSRPAVEAGAHPRIAGTGWQSAWDVNLPADKSALSAFLKCDATYQTWTDSAGSNENLPINCLTWYEAFAFCAWDEGRLPTEAEWEYVAAGGNDNGLYPWGGAAPDATLAVFNCCGDGTCGTTDCTFADILAAGATLAGDAQRFGHADLAGSMFEWVFDWHDAGWYANPAATGTDVANLTATSSRVIRGGSFKSPAQALRAAFRGLSDPRARTEEQGLRCARTP
jgi:formylglycine-generating enzyme required for sulfatase activity